MKFATCLSCIDGRTHLPVLGWISQNYKVDCVDLITEPGMVRRLTNNRGFTKALINKIYISKEKHLSNILFITAHYDCAGNPVSDSLQKKQVARAVEKMSSLFPDTTVVGLWVNNNWEPEEIAKFTTDQ